MDQGPVAPVAQRVFRQRGKQARDVVGRDRVRVADDVPRHGDLTAEFGGDPAFVVRIGEEASQRDQSPRTRSWVGQHVSKLDLIAAQDRAVNPGQQVIGEWSGAQECHELGEVLPVGTHGRRGPVALHAQPVEELFDLVRHRVRSGRERGPPTPVHAVHGARSAGGWSGAGQPCQYYQELGAA